MDWVPTMCPILHLHCSCNNEQHGLISQVYIREGETEYEILVKYIGCQMAMLRSETI